MNRFNAATIDGMVTSWAAFEPYKFQEVAFYHLEIPIGSSPSMFMMSRTKYDSLPPAARKALDDNIGEAFVREAAKTFCRPGDACPQRDRAAQHSQDCHADTRATRGAGREIQTDCCRLG